MDERPAREGRQPLPAVAEVMRTAYGHSRFNTRLKGCGARGIIAPHAHPHQARTPHIQVCAPIEGIQQRAYRRLVIVTDMGSVASLALSWPVQAQGCQPATDEHLF